MRKRGEQSKKLVEGTISPLREQLGEFKKRIEDVYDKEAKDRASLQTHIQVLQTQSQSLGKQALDLAQALKGQSKVRGSWGEQSLETLLETSGLQRGIEFEAQKSLKSDDGSRKQPDVIVHLPEGRHVVIDAKVSLTDYLAYCAAETDEDRQAAARAHLASLRSHITDLASNGPNKDQKLTFGEVLDGDCLDLACWPRRLGRGLLCGTCCWSCGGLSRVALAR
jgi:DNA recombination protein RmuC